MLKLPVGSNQEQGPLGHSLHPLKPTCYKSHDQTTPVLLQMYPSDSKDQLAGLLILEAVKPKNKVKNQRLYAFLSFFLSYICTLCKRCFLSSFKDMSVFARRVSVSLLMLLDCTPVASLRLG